MKLQGKISTGYWVLAGTVVTVIISGLIALNIIMSKYAVIVDQQYPALLQAQQSGASSEKIAKLEQEIQIGKDTASTIGKGLNVVMPGFMLFAIVGGVYAATRVPKRIVQPVTDLVLTTTKVAEGDLTGSCEKTSDDEIGQLAESFCIMLHNLKSLIQEINISTNEVANTSTTLALVADEVANASTQITSVMYQVADGNSRQVMSIEDTMRIMNEFNNILELTVNDFRAQEQAVNQAAEMVEQMARGVDHIASSVQVVAEVAERASTNASEGGKAVESTINGMEKIKAAVFDSADRIEALGVRSQEIGDIVEVITDIAEQTNMLALNASIEAARAGEHGKGFAVVAGEVRKLAESSSKATKEIAHLITQIRTDIERAMGAMQTGTKEVDNGSKLAEQARGALSGILQGINKTNVQVQGISSAVEELLASGQEVNHAVGIVRNNTSKSLESMNMMRENSSKVDAAVKDISEIARDLNAGTQEAAAATETMNASTEEIAASSQNLAHMSMKLQEIIDRFKV